MVKRRFPIAALMLSASPFVLVGQVMAQTQDPAAQAAAQQPQEEVPAAQAVDTS